MTEEKKVYKSFKDIPPREYMYFPKGTIEPSKPGEFSKLELQHIVISMLVLSIAFTFALSGNNLIEAMYSGYRLDIIPEFFAMSIIGVLTAFFVHEMSHKLIAQKRGLWAEYRMFPKGLSLAAILGFLTPIVFAAPGAVMFRGGAQTHETGKIAIAGPGANIAIAAVTLPLYHLFIEEPTIGRIFGFICFINALLGTFNILPIEPLDGTKIIKWNATAWIILLIIAILILLTITREFVLVI